MELEELYDKHHVLTDGLQRVYVINRIERRLDMDRSTPIEMHFLAPRLKSDNYLISSNPESYVIKERSWVQMIKELCLILIKHYSVSKDVLYGFRVDWSNAVIFDKTKSLVNMQKLDDDLYVNVGHASNHMLWLLEDIFSFFSDDDWNHPLAYILVHRSPFSEPSEIREAVEKRMKESFKVYLANQGLNNEKIEKVFKGIDSLNFLLRKTKSSYDNFYLIDDTQMFSTYKSKLLSELPKYVNWTIAQEETAKKYLNYLTNYFTLLKQEAKKKPIDFYIPIL